MQVQHPRATDADPRDLPSAVSIPGHGNVAVDADGYLADLDAGVADRAMRALGDAYEVNYSDDGDVVLDGGPRTCDVVKSDDDVCGRELPCPYHSDEEA